jgi:hypothetical protein
MRVVINELSCSYFTTFAYHNQHYLHIVALPRRIMSKRNADPLMPFSRRSKRLTSNAVLQMPEAPAVSPPSRTAYAPAPTSLMGLPREMRDQIYHEVWNQKAAFDIALPGKQKQSTGPQLAKVQYDMGYPLLYQGHEPKPTPQREPWFLASKQLCVEAIEQFQRGATWIFIGCRNNIAYFWTPPVYAGRWKAPPSRRAVPSLSLYLLTPDHATSITIEGPAEIESFFEVDSKENGVKYMSFTDTILMPALYSCLTDSIHLRNIDMFMKVADWQRVGTAVPTVVDFGKLQKLELPCLKQLRVFVEYVIEVPEDKTPKEVFRRALSEFGMKLIGNTGVESTDDKHHSDETTFVVSFVRK